jgi:hypothetical protein
MNSTPEMLYSRLIYLNGYFKPFNWNYKVINNESYLLNNINNNKYYLRYEKLYNLICKLYPSKKDITNFTNGFFIDNNDIYKIDINNIDKSIARWTNLNKNYINNIKNDIETIKLVSKEKKVKIFDCINEFPVIYKLYKKDIISNITLGYAYYKNDIELEKLKLETKVKERSIKKNIYYLEVYKSYKILRLLMLQ